MSKKIHFVSGMPRACSTLLMNLMAQNPRIHSTPTSALHEIGYIARQVFQTEEAKAVDMEKVLEPMYFDYVRAGCENAFNSLTDRPVVVDKGRSWVGHLDQTFKTWPNAKVIVPIRDMRGILTSLEKKRRKHPEVFNAIEKQNPQQWTTIEKRVNGWLASPPVGIAIERVLEASQRFGDKLLFVHAEDLASNPQDVMNRVWEYLEEEPFIHNVNNVEQYTEEYDIGFPYGDHVIRPKVEPLIPEWHEVLGRQLSEQINQKFSWINDL